MPAELKSYIDSHFGDKKSWLVTKEVVYKNTTYMSKENQAVLYHPSREMVSFEIGKNLAFVTSKEKKREPESFVVVRKMAKCFLPELGVYKCQETDEFTHIKIKALAHYHPLYIVSLPRMKSSYVSLIYEPFLAN